MAGSGTAHLRDDALLRVENMLVEFPLSGRRSVHAVSDLSFDILEGETLGLVGESGCGKSTAARAVMQLPKPNRGTVAFDGTDLTKATGQRLRKLRKKIQMIFQDPISSLNPRRKVADIVAEPVRIWGLNGGSHDRVVEVMEAVGLDPAIVSDRRPHQFSGGQCQRISIARALALQPKLLICDEPVSSLDVSVQAQILNLLEDMKAQYDLTMLFISHDLAVVKNISDRVAVMYLGKLCEIAPSEELYAHPAHPYSAGLVAAIPEPDPARHRYLPIRLSGEPPSPIDPPSGCRFRTRCPRAQSRCAVEEPVVRKIGPGHFVACHYPVEPPSA